MRIKFEAIALLSLLMILPACREDDNGATDTPDVGEDVEESEVIDRPPGPDHDGIYSFAGGCYAIEAYPSDSADPLSLVADDSGYSFEETAVNEATPFFMKATDLGSYLFFDDEELYFLVEEEDFSRVAEFLSDFFTLDDDYLPGVQWALEVSSQDETRFQLRHHRTGRYLATDGLVEEPDQAALVGFHPSEGCADYPELTLDAEGEVYAEPFDDGSVYGFVETHSHILSNFGFGGAGIFHGAPFHPFGVTHALPSCEAYHGIEGRNDVFGYAFDQGGDVDEVALLQGALDGETPEFNHHTEGFPEFTDWPSAPDKSTHQTQYHVWMKRAYLSGLRLMVQHATTNQVICELLEGTGAQPTRYSCNDMVAADRIIDETRNMERYIDAQYGGPGEGWFRIVESPEEAREVINDGKMAVVLGLEVSNLFDCFLVPADGFEHCTEQDVLDGLDEYYERGVRAIFPVHKFDNGFSAGDGHREFIEIGNFVHTGHWSNFTDDCPDLPSAFDYGDVAFGDLNEPRDDYFAPPPNDMSEFPDDPVGALFNYLNLLLGDSLEGDYCQNHGLTDLGEFLIEELMRRGIIIEIDHLPRRSYQRAFEMLTANDYPAVGTHGNNNNGKIYELGGVSKFNFGRCNDPDNPGGRLDGLRNRLSLIEDAGAYPAEGFGFDLNGFAGAPGPRFGEKSSCGDDQDNPITYPFTSYDGQITFTQPFVGEREIDFNTEGMAHLGLVAELIEDVRRDGATDEDLEPLFRSAEGYLRMWEKSIERGAAISQQ